MNSPIVAALAEVVTIVVGVLLALAADRWKERRADRKLERHYLQGLVTDLRKDRDGLSGYLKRIGEALDAAEAVLRVARSEESPNSSTFVRDMVRAGDGSEPAYSLATYTELSHGRLHLIQNEALKDAIVEYYSQVMTGERADSRVTPQLWYDPGVEPYVLEIWKILPPGNWWDWLAGGEADVDVDRVVCEVQENVKIQEYLEAARRCRALQMGKFEIHRSQAEELLRAVRTELGNPDAAAV